MSGGERKVKRNPRGQGWEEAGGEFYQESYPGGEAELEAMHQNPSNIATLLPSKQNRTGEYFFFEYAVYHVIVILIDSVFSLKFQPHIPKCMMPKLP